jgi:DNA modification methylase
VTPYHVAPDCTFFVGDVRAVLAELPPASVHTIVTSPPYYGLRNYGIAPSVWGGSAECEHDFTERRWYSETTAAQDSGDAFSVAGEANAKRLKEGRWKTEATCSRCSAWRGVLGLESVPDCLGWARGVNCGQCYICHMREVAAGLWRVLRDDSVMFVNIGDSYNGSGKGGNGGPTSQLNKNGMERQGFENRRSDIAGLAPKNRVGIPERLALALQADGWVWRDTIHLCKTSPMPESVRDRTTQAHEYLYLFSKKARYYFDADAVRERTGDESTWEQYQAADGRFHTHEADGAQGMLQTKPANFKALTHPLGRNPRSWMLVSPEHTNGTSKHYATFIGGRTIPSFAIRAGSSEYGVCEKCGAPWERVTETKFVPQTNVSAERNNFRGKEQFGGKLTGVPRGTNDVTTLGFRPTCKHSDGPVVPATVLDPFSGSGTSQITARQLGRRSVYIDLSESYCLEAIKRLEGETPMLEGMVPSARASQAALGIE